MWSPNTARVLASASSMGVPVKPMNEALGSASRHVAGVAVDEVVLAAVRLVGDHHDVPPVGAGGTEILFIAA